MINPGNRGNCKLEFVGGKIMINFDFLVSGCNTQCKHCYVNGGPIPMMVTEDVFVCIDKLDEIAKFLRDETSFTLDHEPMNHPAIGKIIKKAAGTKNIKYYHHGMTTGIGLMNRNDRDDVMRAYLDCGYDSFGITIHGSAEHHDEIVRRKKAYNRTMDAAMYMKSQGATLDVSLMLNRFFVKDGKEISNMIETLNPDNIFLALPIYTPHCNMKEFEGYRATVEDVESLQNYFIKWKQNSDEIIDTAKRYNPRSVADKLKKGMNLQELFEQEQDELYLTVHQDCKLYVGNSGAETRCLGDLKEINIKDTAKTINGLPGNRDYGAFYDIKELPAESELIKELETLPQNYAYGDMESVIYRGLAEIKVPTKICI